MVVIVTGEKVGSSVGDETETGTTAPGPGVSCLRLLSTIVGTGVLSIAGLEVGMKVFFL